MLEGTAVAQRVVFDAIRKNVDIYRHAMSIA